MIYLRAGLYAEGSTDYRFLGPLVERLMYELGATMLPGLAFIGQTAGIDASRGAGKRREERIAAAIDEHWSECTIFVVHSDGAGDPEAARRYAIDPGLVRARSRYPDLAAAACIPVREVEAWMLVDTSAFRLLLGVEPHLSMDPQVDPEPKASLKRAFTEAGAKPQMVHDAYRFFGENVRLDRLRRLTAFQAFEAELGTAILAVAGA